MGFEESALTRLRRYRQEADTSLAQMREVEEMARGFAGRLFGGLGYAAALTRQAGFEIEVENEHNALILRCVAGENAEAGVTFAVVSGAAAESDEDLMHEELSRYSLDPPGYSGRILGWTPAVGEEPCQIFAVYRDGVWKTKGLFVAKARGKVDDLEDILNGFCLRIVGRLIDLAATSGGVGRRWANVPYSLQDCLEGREHPTESRLPH